MLKNKFIGQHVVVRTYSAGVHIGTLTERESKEVVLSNARRLWKWSGAFTLSEVAINGINSKNSRMSITVPEILISEVIEVIPTSKKAQETFDATHE
jgi:ferredoxin-fold anticodon binding domain-containing protein